MKKSRRSSNTGRSSSGASSPSSSKSRRTALVSASLVGSLVLTSVLLLLLAPAPLTAPPVGLVAPLEVPVRLDAIYDTPVKIQADRWRTIYVHHSKTRRGSLPSLLSGGLADHFIIGNGEEAGDGEIQFGQRWQYQQPAQLPGVNLPERAISICLVGDLDHQNPTPAQVKRLAELVRELQQNLRIGRAAVLAYNQAGHVAGIGERFPIAEFAQALRP